MELTARIGKELLQQNNKLEASVSSLESELRAANEKLTQLSHEIIKKTELIQILTNDVDDASPENGLANGGRINLEVVQKRIGKKRPPESRKDPVDFFISVSLEDENKALKNEYVRLAQDTDDVEAKEQQLVKDITGQLGKYFLNSTIFGSRYLFYLFIGTPLVLKVNITGRDKAVKW